MRDSRISSVLQTRAYETGILHCTRRTRRLHPQLGFGMARREEV